MAESSTESPKRRKRSCLGCFGQLLLWSLLLALLSIAVTFASLALFPPFGSASTAQVLLVGLDEQEFKNDRRRADTVMLFAGPLDGSGATLLSVPRDSRVSIPGHGNAKINAAYAWGEVALLKKTLAQPSALQADLPNYLVFDSATVRAVVDALGGIEVNVPHRMDYDDNWGKLHIHLEPGIQVLNGEQTIGYLRWRKNTDGSGFGTDFDRGKRQRTFVAAVTKKAKSLDGLWRLPSVYQAFREHTKSNLSFRHLLMMGWAARTLRSETMPLQKRQRLSSGYVYCDWEAGRNLWQSALR